jgi:hypothetical protein
MLVSRWSKCSSVDDTALVMLWRPVAGCSCLAVILDLHAEALTMAMPWLLNQRFNDCACPAPCHCQ